ncbi:MAG: UbiA prenyltransferase family protein [Candidatus Thorarchaeota archaeon]
MSKVKSLLHLLRIRQYYKNILILAGIFFSERLFETPLYLPLILGFIILCCASSFNYIINDIIDVEHDRKHPEKMKKKPLASGQIPIYYALILLIAIVSLMIICIILLNPNIVFISMVILIIITGQAYNHLFKKYAFIDILVLSTGYLWRALAGCVIINEYVSPWLFLAIFEIAMFLSIAKRKSDLLYLGADKAIEHKKVYSQYSSKLLDQFHVMIATSLFMTYSLYIILRFFNSFESDPVLTEQYIVIFTIPISLYIIMRYMYLTSKIPEIGSKTEKALFDKGIILAGICLFLILSYTFYYSELLNLFLG